MSKLWSCITWNDNKGTPRNQKLLTTFSKSIRSQIKDKLWFFWIEPGTQIFCRNMVYIWCKVILKWRNCIKSFFFAKMKYSYAWLNWFTGKYFQNFVWLLFLIIFILTNNATMPQCQLWSYSIWHTERMVIPD